MKTIYKDSNHFDEETFIQATFFKMSVNVYRKGIAERFGYKSSKLFKEFLDEKNKEADIFLVTTQEIGDFPLKTKHREFHNRDLAIKYFENQKSKSLSKNNFQTTFQEKSDKIDYPFSNKAWEDKIKINTPLKDNIFTFTVEMNADFQNANNIIQMLDGIVLNKKRICGYQTDFTFKLKEEITEHDLRNKIKDIVLSNEIMCDMKYFYLTVKSGFESQDEFVYSS